MDEMQIGELAGRTGVATKTIRYYEDIGVLPIPARSPNGYRNYEESAVERLRFIRDAKATGLTLSEIASVLDLREQGASTCEHVAGLLEHHCRRSTSTSVPFRMREPSWRPWPLVPKRSIPPTARTPTGVRPLPLAPE